MFAKQTPRYKSLAGFSICQRLDISSIRHVPFGTRFWIYIISRCHKVTPYRICEANISGKAKPYISPKGLIQRKGFGGRFTNRPSKMYYPAVDELFLFNTSAQRRNRPPWLTVASTTFTSKSKTYNRTAGATFMFAKQTLHITK